MKNAIKLPLTEPLYSTYHHQGAATAVISDNPTLRNWYLTNAVSLSCELAFLFGRTTPLINVENSSWLDCPYFRERWFDSKYILNCSDKVIKNLIDDGFYVVFGGVDDFFVKGKTWYKKRHFNHDGLICGYDKRKKTYDIYAYDINWIYRRFETPQKGFVAGLVEMSKHKYYEPICGIKPRDNIIDFEPEISAKKIKEYLDSSFEKYPPKEDAKAFGNIVHDYIAKYIDMILEEKIPYEKIDNRIFRMIFEHKKAMLERISLTEKILSTKNNHISERYQNIVSSASSLRLLYASYCIKRKDSVLLSLREKLLKIKEEETKIIEVY